MINKFKGSFAIFFTLLLVGASFLLFSKKSEAQVVTDPAQRAALQAQLNQIEKDIADQQSILTQKQTEGSSIARDIAILDAKIKSSQLKIKAYER